MRWAEIKSSDRSGMEHTFDVCIIPKLLIHKQFWSDNLDRNRPFNEMQLDFWAILKISICKSMHLVVDRTGRGASSKTVTWKINHLYVKCVENLHLKQQPLFWKCDKNEKSIITVCKNLVIGNRGLAAFKSTHCNEMWMQLSAPTTKSSIVRTHAF